MKNILKVRNITLIFISSLVILMLSLSGCIGGGDNADNNGYSTDNNAIQENNVSDNKPNTDNTVQGSDTGNNKPGNNNILQENSNIIYPNSKLHDDVPEYYYAIMGITTEGITINAYETSDTVEDVLNWYENKMTSLGYDITMNATIAKISNPQGTFEYGIISFKKENDAIGIWAIGEPTQERTIYFISKGPADKLLGSSYESSEYAETEDDTTSYNYEVEEPQLPTSDKASGEEPIKRYPGSVMLEYSMTAIGNGKIISTEYGTDKDPQDVFNWYKDYFKNEGWNISHMRSDGSEYSISCSKNKNDTVIVSIWRDDYTTIDVKYYHNMKYPSYLSLITYN
ncbi:hypothetical protein KKP97_01410 [Methanothermococcus sp. SCGC AD-155-C09]|nr:hypothetical protein [Methanothermococcus sp. SCGC AD-155-C09]